MGLSLKPEQPGLHRHCREENLAALKDPSWDTWRGGRVAVTDAGRAGRRKACGRMVMLYLQDDSSCHPAWFLQLQDPINQ